VGEIFIIRSLADFAGIALLESFHVQLIERKVRQENELLSKMLQMQYDNYRISEESVALVNQKYHDLKHQIRMLRNESNSRERTEYLDQMEQEIKRYEARFQTGNRILDTMLGAKSMQCMNEDIKMITVAEGQPLAFMNAMDISALFGNALDNAIESVRKISSPDRRLIHVTVSRQKNFLRIRVENCCDAKVDFKDGLPITTKGDRRYHGYGTKSIRSIVDKYGGSLTIESEDGWYRLRILFPLPATEGSL
jgi:sensor histidine kinase regulating citrate/malate metabolism